MLLFLVTIRGLTRQKTEGWMAATAVVLVFVANYQHEMRLIHILRPLTHFSILGFDVSLGTAATVVSLLMITVLLLIRYFNTQKLKEQWKLEIQQAQHVQQILIPTELPQIPGLTIDSAYRPAREVGGDFFQVLPGDEPGSVLIVVGDVTGKGMQAGMLVATIVGALRGAALHTSDPVADDARGQRAALRTPALQRHLPDSLHRSRRQCHPRQRRPVAALSEWAGDGDGGRATARYNLRSRALGHHLHRCIRATR